MSLTPLCIVLVCYMLAAQDEFKDEPLMAGVWGSYALSVVFFILIKLKKLQYWPF